MEKVEEIQTVDQIRKNKAVKKEAERIAAKMKKEYEEWKKAQMKMSEKELLIDTAVILGQIQNTLQIISNNLIYIKNETVQNKNGQEGIISRRPI